MNDAHDEWQAGRQHTICIIFFLGYSAGLNTRDIHFDSTMHGQYWLLSASTYCLHQPTCLLCSEAYNQKKHHRVAALTIFVNKLLNLRLICTKGQLCKQRNREPSPTFPWDWTTLCCTSMQSLDTCYWMSQDYLVLGLINSLWPSNTIWRWRSGSTLAQVMACCLMAPSHYLNLCWLIIREV